MLPKGYRFVVGARLLWRGKMSPSVSTVEVLSVDGETLTMRTVGPTEAGATIPRSSWKASAASVRDFCEEIV